VLAGLPRLRRGRRLHGLLRHRGPDGLRLERSVDGLRRAGRIHAAGSSKTHSKHGALRAWALPPSVVCQVSKFRRERDARAGVWPSRSVALRAALEPRNFVGELVVFSEHPRLIVAGRWSSPPYDRQR
jgi:hypothetical protein